MIDYEDRITEGVMIPEEPELTPEQEEIIFANEDIIFDTDESEELDFSLEAFGYSTSCDFLQLQEPGFNC